MFMAQEIYAALGLLGLCVGLATLILSAKVIKPKEGAGELSASQSAWFLWVAGVAELIASLYFALGNSTVNAATFGGYGLFWMALGTMVRWNGDSRVLGPISIGYAVFSLGLAIVFATVSLTLFLVVLMLFLIFLALIPAAWGKESQNLLLVLYVLCLIFALIAVLGLIFASVPELSKVASAFLWPPIF